MIETYFALKVYAFYGLLTVLGVYMIIWLTVCIIKWLKRR